MLVPSGGPQLAAAREDARGARPKQAKTTSTFLINGLPPRDPRIPRPRCFGHHPPTEAPSAVGEPTSSVQVLSPPSPGGALGKRRMTRSGQHSAFNAFNMSPPETMC